MYGTNLASVTIDGHGWIFDLVRMENSGDCQLSNLLTPGVRASLPTVMYDGKARAEGCQGYNDTHE